MADLKVLKKEAKSKIEAERFELRYKKIKFVEKRKVIRRIEQAKDEKEKKDWQQKLIYIDVSTIFIFIFNRTILQIGNTFLFLSRARMKLVTKTWRK